MHLPEVVSFAPAYGLLKQAYSGVQGSDRVYYPFALADTQWHAPKRQVLAGSQGVLLFHGHGLRNCASSTSIYLAYRSCYSRVSHCSMVSRRGANLHPSLWLIDQRPAEQYAGQLPGRIES